MDGEEEEGRLQWQVNCCCRYLKTMAEKKVIGGGARLGKSVEKTVTTTTRREGARGL